MSLNPRLDYSPDPLIPLNESQERARVALLELYQSGEMETEEVPCYCGEEGGQEIAARDRYGFPVRTLLCMRCGLLRTSPRMSAAFADRFYRDLYRPLYDPAWNHPELRFEHDRRRGARMVSKIPTLLSKIETVFDVGCAAGGALEAFRQAGKRTAGCDMTARYIEFGRSRGLQLVEGEAAELVDAFGGRADLVIFSHVLEHLFDLKREFEEVLDAVRPGGFVLVMVPGLDTVATDYRGDLLLYLQNAHNYHFSAATLRMVPESCGATVLVAEEDGTALVQRPDGWEKGREHSIEISPRAGMENLSRLLRFESARASVI